MLRGVSGGERKRVTTGEMAFGNKFVLMMDEISTGLDSAATFDIISTQRSLAKTFNKTIVISLLQPSPEVFELFDDVLLLNKGYVMYHGARCEVQSYFEDMGFHCPPNRDVADFLMDLGTNKHRQSQTSTSFQQNFLTGTATIIARELRVLFQDSAAVLSRLFMALVIGLLSGSAFYQFDELNSHVIMGLAYTAVDTLSVAKSRWF
ncbi:ATP-binding Cassette (ABC) Superfamily [Phytophthora infestans T30-4]|uniref:ATP-binding Cassette (ABC) Superfamily n=1 Tax=Phytophthora infestans (strain T30-4) TaxID=403677 RepID=D0MUB6_PHYIT|nr:ATP-binding Cassette (ABC) Superfamily [Phytophthora infestans T30-4]EEY61563.1 ATP-binding Cassette (ABC) Superfamily [Phytophthora infestans T30-4]|eukprot:XP_002908480.1 ATP-binding Cassette (ABC) Superfamily [Phytophthora infestans T30-4]